MNRDELDTLWFQAMRQSIEEGENFIRYHFAALVADHEREACAKLADEFSGKVWTMTLVQQFGQENKRYRNEQKNYRRSKPGSLQRGNRMYRRSPRMLNA